MNSIRIIALNFPKQSMLLRKPHPPPVSSQKTLMNTATIQRRCFNSSRNRSGITRICSNQKYAVSATTSSNGFSPIFLPIHRGTGGVTLGTSMSNNNCIGRYQQRALSTSSADKTSMEDNPFNSRRLSNANEDDLPPITLNNTIRMKNAGMAAALVAFCFGVAYYSMHAVGQSGASASTNDDDASSSSSSDPLSVLKAEAAVAQQKHDKAQQETDTTADMLQKFQKGEYDPDHISDDELDDLDDKNSKPWWKFW